MIARRSSRDRCVYLALVSLPERISNIRRYTAVLTSGSRPSNASACGFRKFWCLNSGNSDHFTFGWSGRLM